MDPTPTPPAQKTSSIGEGRLRPRWLRRSALISLALGGGYWLVSIGIVLLMGVVCPPGWGGLECAVILGFFVMLVMSGLLLMGGTIALQGMIFYRWADAVGAMFPATVAVLWIGKLFGGYQALDMGGGAVISIVLTTVYYSALVWIPVLISIAIGRISRPYGWLVAGLCTTALVAGIAYGVTKIQIQTTHAQYQQEEIQKTEQLGITLYQPSYVASGYKLSSTLLHQAYADEDIPYYEISYTAKDDNSAAQSYSIYESKVSSYYKPPQNCGAVTPVLAPTADDTPEPCEKIGTVSDGCDVYFTAPDYTNQIFAYCQRGETLIGFETILGFAGDSQAAQKAEVMRVFESLHETSAKELQALNT